MLADQTRVDHIDWHLVPRFMLRVAGLPFGAADRLVGGGSAGWADEVLAGERRLAADAAALADELQAFVGGNLRDDTARKLVINLRRDVFNLRLPRGLQAAEQLLPADLLAHLHAWLAERERQQALLADGMAITDEEISQARRELREIAGSHELRCGIQLSSPSLDEHLDGYLRADPGRLNKRERRIERSLLEYLFRTACKTSPFGTLTPVALGAVADDVGRAVRADVRHLRQDSSTLLNVGVLSRLSNLMMSTPEMRRDLPVRPTGGLQLEANRLRYLRRLQTARGNDDAAVSMDAMHESLFYLPSGPALREVLDLLGDTEPMRYAELARRLAALGEDRSAEEVDAYLSHLLRLGLLVVPDLQLDLHDRAVGSSYQDALRRLGSEWAEDTAEIVGRIDAHVAEFAGADLVRRRALLARIRGEITEAHRVLNRTDVGVLRTLVYENTTVPGVTVTADRQVWTGDATAGLRQLATILPAFDGNLVRRLVTKGYFVIRHGSGGRCEDFLSFAHEFGQDFYDNYSQGLMRHQRFDGTEFHGYDNWFRQPEIGQLDQARLTVTQELAQRYTELTSRAEPAEGAGADLELGDDFIAAVSQQLPAGLGALQPTSFFLQVADDGANEPLVVVNRVYTGLTLLFSRFAHLFGAELPAELRGALDAVTPEGAVFAELKGGADATNLNLHPIVTPYEIVSPGEVSFRPAAEQIPVEDLIVEHDPVADRLLLRSRRLGVEVIPAYLGFLLPMALPEVQQVLLNFSYASLASLDLWAGVDLPTDRIIELPRIRLGNVVAQRRTWRIPPAELPADVDGRGEHEWYLAWRRWQRAAGLPRRVFASLGGEHKPLYVDFDSYFSVQLLHTATRGATATAVLTEMLPGPEELWLRNGEDRYVTELTVEFNGMRMERR
ncbi:lantibiotic dehydratase [Jatrophihabitans sp.]|uniref:lantibiotic dehydratase n=1 Tax=Jatrophihabitans sp. TaxID=1932789 RepID=UPI0038CD7D0D